MPWHTGRLQSQPTGAIQPGKFMISIDLTKAILLVCEYLPGCRNLSAESLQAAAHAVGCSLNWLPFDDDLCDRDLFRIMNSRFMSIKGCDRIMHVTGASYESNRVCIYTRDELQEGVVSHSRLYGRSAFDGDTLFLGLDSGSFVVFSHESVCAAFKASRSG